MIAKVECRSGTFRKLKDKKDKTATKDKAPAGDEVPTEEKVPTEDKTDA